MADLLTEALDALEWVHNADQATDRRGVLINMPQAMSRVREVLAKAGRLDSTHGVPEVQAPSEQVSPALARQRRLVATLPQTAEQVALLTPCAALGNGTTPVHCGHCGQTVTPGGACAHGVPPAQPQQEK